MDERPSYESRELECGWASGPMVTPEDGSVPAGLQAPVPHLGAAVRACVLVCAVVCVSLGMTRSEISETVSSALSPVSVGAQKSYMTPALLGALKKN